MPGILGERFFSCLDTNDDQSIDQKEFIHAMFKVYYSKLESKMKLVFDMYDFDSDGQVTKEDIRLVLSHVPIAHMNKSIGTHTAAHVQEGKFT